MKKKLKKVLVLTAMVTCLGALPNCVMAQSDNGLSKGTIIEKTGYQFTAVNAASLRIDLKDTIDYKGSPKTFYVMLENAKWLDSINTVDTSKYFRASTFKKINDTTLEVKMNNSILAGVKYVPLLVELTGGEAKVSVDGMGTEISDMKATTFAITSESKAEVTVGEIPSIREEDNVATIRIDEIIKGSLTSSSRSEDRTITLELQNDNYEFENPQPLVTGSKGLSGMTSKAKDNDKYTGEQQFINVRYGFSNGKEDKSVLKVYLPQVEDAMSVGRISISELRVKTNKFQPGIVSIKVSGTALNDKIVQVADAKEYGILIRDDANKIVAISNGNSEEVSFTIAEDVLESMVEKRTLEITVENGYLAPKQKAGISDLSLGKLLLNGKDITKTTSFNPVIKDNYLVGFNFDIPTLDSTVRNKFSIENLKIYAPATASGVIKVTSEVAGTKLAATTTIANIKTATQIRVSSLKLKVGIKDQVGGKLIIKETDKSMLKQGVLELEIEEQEGITYGEVPNVKVIEGNIKIGTVTYDGIVPNKLKIKIERESSKPSTIEISGFNVTVDNTVPDGHYKLSIKGTAVSPDVSFGSIEYPHFMTIGDIPVTEEPLAPAFDTSVMTNTSKFVIGSNIYLVNGIPKTMDGAAYIESNKTMVPVRYIADAIGIPADAIHFKNQVVTIQTADKIINLAIGSNMIEVNGERQGMSGKAVIKNDRAYVPVAEIAKALGVKVEWEPKTQTALFSY
ncbi:hypothetical protein CS063_08815 [Sporanaerobium hydrogeniformans]|uniref:Uncharacterized protein n=1 Tax=Sporanaerobium hydrogeniformans TaxID=3072179 RepID=A0AC61DDG5_9FIRM|nr:stalk domain-containing protein [Sporanaerobium hydrogeniformans]PHV70855.1 hypothetical protein CS063_08815 [Sporanaerobium hydrogeniformans]